MYIPFDCLYRDCLFFAICSQGYYRQADSETVYRLGVVPVWGGRTHKKVQTSRLDGLSQKATEGSLKGLYRPLEK